MPEGSLEGGAQGQLQVEAAVIAVTSRGKYGGWWCSGLGAGTHCSCHLRQRKKQGSSERLALPVRQAGGVVLLRAAGGLGESWWGVAAGEPFGKTIVWKADEGPTAMPGMSTRKLLASGGKRSGFLGL